MVLFVLLVLLVGHKSHKTIPYTELSIHFTQLPAFTRKHAYRGFWRLIATAIATADCLSILLPFNFIQ